jgi:hypothetical protein
MPIERLHTRQQLRKIHEIAKQGIVDFVRRLLLLDNGATLDVTLLPDLGLRPSEWHKRTGAYHPAQQDPSVHCRSKGSDHAGLPCFFHLALRFMEWEARCAKYSFGALTY